MIICKYFQPNTTKTVTKDSDIPTLLLCISHGGTESPAVFRNETLIPNRFRNWARNADEGIKKIMTVTCHTHKQNQRGSGWSSHTPYENHEAGVSLPPLLQPQFTHSSGPAMNVQVAKLMCQRNKSAQSMGPLVCWSWCFLWLVKTAITLCTGKLKPCFCISKVMSTWNGSLGYLKTKMPNEENVIYSTTYSHTAAKSK